jgi:hypothetical protein
MWQHNPTPHAAVLQQQLSMLAVVLQVVSVKLAKHVVKNHDKLIEGISNVTSVEDDLQVGWPVSSAGSR